MIVERHYYKITNIDSTELYVSTNLPLKSNKLCEILGLGDYTAVEITKQEYDENTEDEE